MSIDTLIDHERIWLQNQADANQTEGRMWCQDKVWPESVEDHEPTEYVRADLYAATQAEILRLTGACDEWKASHGRVVEGFAEVCEAVGVPFDAPEAVAYAINVKISNAEHDKRAAESEILRLKAALERIRDEPEVHTKLNQERLCCKFQDIAACSLSQDGEEGA